MAGPQPSTRLKWVSVCFCAVAVPFHTGAVVSAGARSTSRGMGVSAMSEAAQRIAPC